LIIRIKNNDIIHIIGKLELTLSQINDSQVNRCQTFKHMSVLAVILSDTSMSLETIQTGSLICCFTLNQHQHSSDLL